MFRAHSCLGQEAVASPHPWLQPGLPVCFGYLRKWNAPALHPLECNRLESLRTVSLAAVSIAGATEKWWHCLLQ